MELNNIIFLYIYVVACSIDCGSPNPIHIESESNQRPRELRKLPYGVDSSGPAIRRPPRQVVQPKWLANMGNSELFVDGKVRVNPQNLKETATIRKLIQDAVNEGRYAVQATMDDSEFNAPPPSPQPSPPPAQWQWNFQMPSPTDQQQAEEQNKRFIEEMQRLWSEFVDGTRKMFGWT